MERQDDGLDKDAERIAKVTYLFGIRPDSDQKPEPAAPAPSVDSAPVVGRVIPQESYRDPVPTTPVPKTPKSENISMHALTKRGMSVAEMTQLLERRELDPDEVASEVERLESVGLLDDDALAENLVRTLSERKGLGRQGIAAELRRRKVDDSAISEALEAIDADDELARAIEVATKRAGQLRSYDAETAKRRLGAFLQRRGYSGGILSQAMSAALAPAQTGPRFR